MHVLITGGAGYIGSHAAKAIALAGHTPIVFDSLIRGNRELVKWGPFIKGDLSDETLLRDTITKYDIDSIMHFAAFAYVGESMEYPLRYFENNTNKSAILLRTACECGVGRFVFSSSCAVYGEPCQLPISEGHPQNPMNPYGESKLLTEKILRWCETAHGLRWVALRYFNAAGADADLETGEVHNPETHLIPLVIEATFPDARPIHIFGDDYPTDDGTAIRDYVHVSDLAEAHLRALEYLCGPNPSAAFNLGTGRGHSVDEIVATVSRIVGRRPRLERHPRRAGDPAILIADSSLANQRLGWTSRHSDLENIISTAWGWANSRARSLSMIR
jgi:UDP-arabinose 4-epimerase